MDAGQIAIKCHSVTLAWAYINVWQVHDGVTRSTLLGMYFNYMLTLILFILAPALLIPVLPLGWDVSSVWCSECERERISSLVGKSWIEGTAPFTCIHFSFWRPPINKILWTRFSVWFSAEFWAQKRRSPIVCTQNLGVCYSPHTPGTMGTGDLSDWRKWKTSKFRHNSSPHISLSST